MSSSAQPVNWSIRRFPQNGALPLTLLLWGAYVLVIVGITVAVAPFDEAPIWTITSVWNGAFRVVWVIAFVTGLSLIGFYLRLHVAHGQTRRGFMSQATVYLVVSSAGLAALTTLGFVLEAAVYRINGWPYFQSPLEYLIGSATDLPVVYARLWLVFAMWMVTGMLVTAGFRRFKVVGLLLTIPLALTMIVLTEDGPGSSHFLGPSFQMQDIAMWSSVPSVLLGLAATWALTRKVAV